MVGEERQALMRVTGGEFCGQKINVPGGRKVRPTQDRVREAIFSSIAPRLPGASFLDLFAGSGAVGLEALSRGAGSVTWVEADSRVFRVLGENIGRIAGDSSQGLPIRTDALRFLRRPSDESRHFDLIFADPPYDRDGTRSWAAKILQILSQGEDLAQGGLFIMEQGSDEAIPESEGWSLLTNKVYGETRLLYWATRSTSNIQHPTSNSQV